MEVLECSMPTVPESPAEPPPENREDKTRRIRVRISMFFDGTGNNKTNTETRKNAKAKAYRADDGKDVRAIYRRILEADPWHESSYFNDYSNVARLKMHTDKVSDYNHSLNIYTEGIGTIDDDEDSTRGAATGEGETGVVAKVEKGLALLISSFVRVVPATEGLIVELVTVDTFGFSRGASAARYCVHRVLHGLRVGRAGKKPSLQERLKAAGYEVEKVEVKAVGLYDTVSALGVAYIDVSDVRTLHLDAVRDASAVYQLAAAEEYRRCFSLTNIDSAVSSGKGSQVFLPGAHSDIGGGYVSDGGENKVLWTGDGSEDLVFYLEAYGWAKEGEARVAGASGRDRRNDIRPMLPDQSGRKIKPLNVHLAYVTRYVKLERTGISNRFSFIPLQLMAKFAREQGLNVAPEIEADYDPAKGSDAMPAALIQRIEAYAERAKATRSSLPEDWQGRDAELKPLRRNYLHFSSSSSAGNHLRSAGWDDFVVPTRRIYSDDA